MINRILVALDGSELAEQALPYASALASVTGAELFLVTAMVPHDRWIDDGVVGRWEQEEEAAATRYLDVMRDRLREKGAAVRTKVVWGRAPVVISAVAEEEAADMIALTTHGRSGIARWVMGSVADKVLHTSPKPLLLVRAQEEPPTPVGLGRILVPLDGSAMSESALPFVERLARQLRAKLLLEQVILPAAALYAGEFIPSTMPVLEEIEAGAKEYLRRIAKDAKRAGLTAEISVDVGYAAETILEAAKLRKADLIALSTHGRTGPGRWIMGSVADAVVRHAELPCLVLPARTVAPDSEKGDVTAAVPMAGQAVVPPPAIVEVPVEPARKSGPAPVKGRHRPESIGRQSR
ncbi:MAG: universal stress protein [Dehalococcoidia bacterium]|nr:universal stress protein [Dehalococcoidia bacterium]